MKNRKVQALKSPVTSDEMKACLTTAAAILMLAIPLRAAEMTLSDAAPGASLTAAHRIQYDVFGTWSTRDRRTFTDDSLGVGIGLNYFFSPFFGVGTGTYFERADLPTHLDASLIGRFPLDQFKLAPYGFGGVGRQFRERGQWTIHIGPGLEFCPNESLAAFFDVSRVFTERMGDFNVYRLGVRIAF